MSFVLVALAGIAAGWLAGRLMKGNGFGLIGDVAVGVAGAYTAALVWGFDAGLIERVLFAFGGALLLLFVVRLFLGRTRGGRVGS